MEIFSLKIGVDSTTGLPYGVFDWTFFTDWDLGVYIQAVMEAQKIGLINKGQAIDRLAYILTFLENRTLKLWLSILVLRCKN